MVILKKNTYEEAEELCKQEPFGYATYKLYALVVANKENKYLL